MVAILAELAELAFFWCERELFCLNSFGEPVCVPVRASPRPCPVCCERSWLEHLECSQASKKERKKTDNPREGWEDGTPPPHRDFKERCVVRYPSPTLGSLPLPISLRSLSPILAATFMPPRGRPTLVVLSLVISSSVASFSSASSCDAGRQAMVAPPVSFRNQNSSLGPFHVRIM